MQADEIIVHPFPPVFNPESRILILGSFPSVASRKNSFYYGHPNNRFWKMLAAIFSCRIPQTVEQKTELLLDHHLALWDVIHSCTVQGSSDASIRNVQVNQLGSILSQCSIETIICNGKAAEKYYRKYMLEQTDLQPVVLPSTSPANAAWSLDRLIAAWKPVLTKGNSDI